MKRLINFFSNLSVSWKFTCAYFAILAVQIVLFGIYLYSQTTNSTINQAKLVMEENLLQTRESILQKESSIENESAIFSFDKNVQSFFDSKFSNSTEQLENYQFTISLPNVEHVIKQNSNIYAIRIFMSDNIVTETHKSYYSINTNSNAALYNSVLQAKSQKDGWISTHESLYDDSLTSSSTRDQVLTFTRKIVSTTTYLETARIDIEVKEDVLFNMLRDPIIKGFGKIFVVDSSNTIISNNIPDLYQKNIGATGITNFQLDKKINQVKKINKVNSIVISIPVTGLNCSIVGIFPVSQFNKEVEQSFVKVIIILIISSIFLGGLIYVVTSALLIRIKKLVKAMKQVKDDNLNVSVEVAYNDEFGELGSSFNHMTSRIHDLVETVYKIQLMERDAELKALEANINPHFLYNTLATISWAARKVNSQEIEKIANSLAKFYRLVLSKGGTVIYVKDEIDMLKAYLYIQKIRFEEMFEVVFDIDDDVYQQKMIKNILQPLVENALNHGIEPKRASGTIIIKGRKIETGICFDIIDDGIGITENKLKDILTGEIEDSTGSGYAIKNIMQRLQAYYGDNHSFNIYSRPGIGTQITIKLSNIDI